MHSVCSLSVCASAMVSASGHEGTPYTHLCAVRQLLRIATQAGLVPSRRPAHNRGTRCSATAWQQLRDEQAVAGPQHG